MSTGHLLIIPLLICHLSCHAIGDDDRESDLSVLIASVESGNQLARQRALLEIAKLGSIANSAVEPICNVLDTPSFAVCALAVDALVAIGKPSIEPLRPLLDAESPMVRAAALQALGRLKSISLERLSGMKSDFEPRVRAASAIALAKFDRPEAALVLIELLKDDDPAVALQACFALKQQTASIDEVVPALAQALSRKEIGAFVTHTLSGHTYAFWSGNGRPVHNSVAIGTLGRVHRRIPFLQRSS